MEMLTKFSPLDLHRKSMMNIKSARLKIVVALVFNWVAYPAMLISANELATGQSPNEFNQSQGEAADFYV